MGQHLLFLYKRGFQSRLSTQSIFNPDYLAMWRGRLGSEITQLDLFWQTLLRTLKFFYLEDSAAQYGIAGPILEWVGAVFAVIGLAVMLYRVLQFDPVSVFTIAMGVGTVLGSAIMVEANFSPHLVAFTLIVPALCAVGLGAVLNLSRIVSPVIVSLITLGLAFPWGYWNYRILSDLNTRRFNRDTWIYRLPIEATKVRSVVNVSHLNLDLGESFYKLLYPNSQRRQQLEGDAVRVGVDGVGMQGVCGGCGDLPRWQLHLWCLLRAVCSGQLLLQCGYLRLLALPLHSLPWCCRLQHR
jgi:hypothetical protein